MLFLLFTIQSLFIFSQVKKTPDVFENAYIINLKGDTIKGQIKLPKIKKVELYQKISFRDAANKYYNELEKELGNEKPEPLYDAHLVFTQHDFKK